MERLVPGLIIASVAAFVGSGVTPEFTKPTKIDSNSNSGYYSDAVQRNTPVVPDDDVVTSTRRGFVPAQDAVCDRVQ
jgi:hypothetical protein